MMPPDATRSMTYLQFQAMRWPLSMMYFSFSWSCVYLRGVRLAVRWVGGKEGEGRGREGGGGDPRGGGVGIGEGERGEQTYILPNNRPKTTNPQNPRPPHPINKQPFPAKHGLTEPLVLILLHHPLRARHIRVFAHHPRLLFGAGETEGGDVAQESGGHEEFAGAGVGGCGHFAGGDEFFEGEFDGAAEGDGGGHCDHYAWFFGEAGGFVLAWIEHFLDRLGERGTNGVGEWGKGRGLLLTWFRVQRTAHCEL